jgi:transcriptional regulator with XRE-family HTH domain
MGLAEQVGTKIKELRERRGLTQSRLAEAASLTSDEVSRIERGVREPRFDTLERLASALRVGVGEFFSAHRDYSVGESRPPDEWRPSRIAAVPEAARIAEQCAKAVERILVVYLRARPARRSATSKAQVGKRSRRP